MGKRASFSGAGLEARRGRFTLQKRSDEYGAMTLVRIDTNATVEWAVLQGNDGRWVAICDPLGLTVEGETWAELMEDIGHSLDAMLKDLLSTNELDQFMHDHGWSTLAAIPNRAADVRFDVPFIPVLKARQY